MGLGEPFNASVEPTDNFLDSGEPIKDSGEPGNDSGEKINNENFKDPVSLGNTSKPNQHVGPNKDLEESLSQIIKRRKNSRKKARQRTKHSNLRKSSRKFGKMDKVSTRSQINEY